MARTQIDEGNIRDRVLTGASFVPDMNFYDETKDYSVDDTVWWKGNWYKALNNITPTTEGDLSNAPDKDATNWSKIQPPLFSTRPSSSINYDNSARVTINFDTVEVSHEIFNLNNSEITFNSNGKFIIVVDITSDNPNTNARTSSFVYLQEDIGGGFQDLPNFKIALYNRGYGHAQDTGSMTIVYDANKGDKLRAQIIADTSNTLQTVPEGCKITIFAIEGVTGPKGDKGDKGDTGQPGDIVWKGDYDSNTTYNKNDAVYYLGSSYVSLVNNNTETPSETSTNWDLLAKKGEDGSGTSIFISKDGSNIPNTPHSTLNFVGINAIDQGSGVARIEPIKNTIAHCTNGPQQTFSNTAVAINLDNITQTSEVSISGTTFTINVSGVYRIRYKINTRNATTTRSNPYAYCEVNGNIDSLSRNVVYSRNNSDGEMTGYVEFTRNFNQNDQIIFYVVNNRNVNIRLLAHGSFMEIEKLNNTSY